MVKRSMVFCLVFVVCFGTGLAYAFDSTNLQTYKSTKSCSECDLSFAKLPRVMMQESRFPLTNFCFASLTQSDFSKSFGQFANFHGANMASVNLQYSDLTGSNFHGANLFGANLFGAKLQRANLSDANLWAANLVNANLGGANLAGANFAGASLSGATWIDGTICKTPSVGICVK